MEEVKDVMEEPINTADVVNELSKDDLLKMMAKIRKEKEEELKKKDEEKKVLESAIEIANKRAMEDRASLEKQLQDADELLKTSNIQGINMVDLPTLEDVAKAIDENPETLRRNFDKYPKKTIERIQMKARLSIDNLVTDLVDENIDADGKSINAGMTAIKEFFDRYQHPEQFDGDFPEEFMGAGKEVNSLLLKLEKWQKNSGQIAIVQAAVWVAYIHYLAKIGEIDEDSIAPMETEDAKMTAVLKELETMKKKIAVLEEQKVEASSEKIAEEQRKEQQELLDKIDETSKTAGAGDGDENPDDPETSVDEKPKKGKKPKVF